MLDVGQANELKMALRREGKWTNKKIKMLCEQKGLLTQVLGVIDGFSEIKPLEFVIDCDVNPMIPDGWTIEKHTKGGAFRFAKDRILLHLAKKQKSGTILGHDLHKELEKEPVLNACVLDYLLAHTHLIPEEWKGQTVFFWGTIYRCAGVNLCIRCLCWDDGRWSWHYHWLDGDWSSGSSAAVAQQVALSTCY